MDSEKTTVLLDNRLRATCPGGYLHAAAQLTCWTESAPLVIKSAAGLFIEKWLVS